VSKKSKVIIGLLAVGIVIGVATILFLRYQIRRSFPATDGSITLSGIQDPTHIYRDANGVPRIAALNEHDLMFAMGFVHAQDRLWQMDLIRRAGEGRLSELFGMETLPFDRMFRIVGIRTIADRVEAALTKESRNRLQWYADGVNAFIESHKGNYPIEFDMLQYDPEPWQPVHSIVLARMMAWELNLSWWTDLTYGVLAERVGLEKALDLQPPFPREVPVTVPADVWKKYAGLTGGFLKTAQNFASVFGPPSLLGGSNAWAISPAKSATGKVILANDTHLHLQVPARWYEIQLSAPGYNVAGMSIAGVPGVVAGRNAHIAWGVTNLMADDADFYIERIDSTDSTRYFYDGDWRKMTIREEEIHLKGDSVVTVVIRSTHHGPIVTDITTPLQLGSSPYVASMRWTGSEISDQIEAFNKIDRASNWTEFIRGIREFSGPGQNFVYGDDQGNIGYWCGVKLPIRGKHSSLLPLPGWDPATEWKGFVPFDELPHEFNPPAGFIASANNKIVDDSYPYHISDLWEPAARIVRLNEVLGSPARISVQDCERLQNDTFSHQAKRMMPYVVAACSDSSFVLPERTTLLEYLKNWNFVFAKEDIATTIYQQFFVTLIQNIYRDEMGDSLFHDWVMLGNIPIRVTTKLIEEGTSPWFDNVRTDSVESRDQIIRESMIAAMATLRTEMGPQMKEWRWGTLHTVTLQHPFGVVKPLDRLFNLGPFPFDGGSTTLVSGEYSFNDPFVVTVGPSFRQIFDLGDPGSWRSILPPGQSGQVFHPHYSDQTQMWLNGFYKTVSTNTGSGKWQDLLLEPGQ
jgi:penicillin G amidase